MPPLRSVAVRFLLATAVLLPAMLLRKERLPTGREWRLLAVLGILMVALPFSLIAWTQLRITSSTTSILFAASPLLTLWMERWIGDRNDRTPVSPRAWLGTLVGLAGVALLFSHVALAAEGAFAAEVVVLLVVVAGSASSIIAKRRLRDIPVLTVAATETLLAGLAVGGMSLIFERNRSTEWTAESIAAILFLGLVSSAFCFLLYYWLLVRMEPYKLASRFLLMPIIAVGEGSLYLHESVPATEFAGGVAVLVSLAMLLSSGSGPQAINTLSDRTSLSTHRKR